MKIKASPHERSVVVELESREATLPPIAIPEIKLRKILVPVDFSESSRKAVQYAILFAKQFNAEILLLHVAEILPSPELVVAESGWLTAKLHEQADKELSEWREKIRPQMEVKTTVQDGTPFWEIIRAADDNNMDLIILGTRGRTGLSRLFLGSTAERVVRHAPCPVMVVREREHDFLAEEKGAVGKQ